MAREDTPFRDDLLEKGQGGALYGAIETPPSEVPVRHQQFCLHRLRQQMAISGFAMCVTLSLITLAMLALLAFGQASVRTQLELWGYRRAPVRFLNVGDWGRAGAYNQSMLADQMGIVGEQMDAQFVISNGDNFYDEGLTGPQDPYFHQSFTKVYTARSLQTQWYSVLGNHDYYGNVLAQLDNHLTNRDPRWSCVRSGTFERPLCEDDTCTETVQFFLFDTVPMVKGYRNKSKNAEHVLDWRGIDTSDWDAYNANQLQELAFNLKASTAKWKVVVGHHPVYSFGSHGDQIELIEQVKPVLERYGADIWVNGHDHNVQHIKRDDSPVHYFTSGGGSKAFKSPPPPEDSQGLQFFWEGQGFAAFHIGTEYLKVEYIGVFGNVMYSTVLRK